LALAGIVVGAAADDFRGEGGHVLGHTTGSISLTVMPQFIVVQFRSVLIELSTG
jgi:hypothetical protein